MSPRDVGGETGQWTESDARIWAAHRGKDQAAVLVFVVPQEIEILIAEHLRLLRDIGSFKSGTATATEMDLRSYALARLQGFVESGIVSTRKVNIMSRLTIGEDLFPIDDGDSLRIADLDFDAENFVDD